MPQSEPHQERGYRNDMLAHLDGPRGGGVGRLGLDSVWDSDLSSGSVYGCTLHIYCHYI